MHNKISKRLTMKASDKLQKKVVRWKRSQTLLQRIWIKHMLRNGGKTINGLIQKWPWHPLMMTRSTLTLNSSVTCRNTWIASVINSGDVIHWGLSQRRRGSKKQRKNLQSTVNVLRLQKQRDLLCLCHRIRGKEWSEIIRYSPRPLTPSQIRLSQAGNEWTESLSTFSHSILLACYRLQPDCFR